MNELEAMGAADYAQIEQSLDDAEIRITDLELKLKEAYDALAHQHNVVTALAKLALRLQ